MDIPQSPFSMPSLVRPYGLRLTGLEHFTTTLSFTTTSTTTIMCGRYALGAAHIDFLEGLQDQYARLFPGRRDGGPDGARVRGGGGGGHGRGPQRLRGGGAGGQDPSLDTAEASSSQDAASSSHMQLERESKANPCMPVAKEEGIKWEREQDFWPR